MLYFQSWSGGKDSTASIILEHIHGLPKSKIIMSEVMFDKKRTLICSILLYAVGTVTALLTVYFHYKGDTSSKIGFLIFCIKKSP